MPRRPNKSPPRCAQRARRHRGRGSTVSPLPCRHPTAHWSPPTRPGRGGIRTRWTSWAGCHGIGSKRCRYPVLLRHGIPAAPRTHVLVGHPVGAIVDQPERNVGAAAVLERDGHISVLSVDIGGFQYPLPSPGRRVGRGKAARDCTADEIAAEVWRQFVTALTSRRRHCAGGVLPWPSWYALDRGLSHGGRTRSRRRPLVRNETPYLVPIVGDWNNRPGTEPWNPHGTSVELPAARGPVAGRSRAAQCLAGPPWRLSGAQQLGGLRGYVEQDVHQGDVDGVCMRVGTPRRQCHSGPLCLGRIGRSRSSGEDDAQLGVSLRLSRSGLSSPIRMPSPAGDYCYVFDIENREPAETRALRILDAAYCEQGLPHPVDTIDSPPIPTTFGGTP